MARFCKVVVGSMISSASASYRVQAVLGAGAFGEVTQCKKLATNETVALKMIKKTASIVEAKEEEKTLKILRERGSDNFNIVRWNESFTYRGRFCLEFEKLDISLHDFMQMKGSLELTAIRPIMQQLATALWFLKSARIVHTDLKPENIMMVDHVDQPLRIKVIDFGSACNNPQKWTGSTLQTLWYRSPEILLGCPFNEAIDIWSLGCIAAELLRGFPLYYCYNEFSMITHIHNTIGKPPDRLLNTGLLTEFYFRKMYSGRTTVWELKPYYDWNPCTFSNLKDLKKESHLSGEDAGAEASDWASFVDLLTKMLKLDAAERITPRQILQHPFLTMCHLLGSFHNSSYVKRSLRLMSVCQRVSAANPAHHSDPDEGHSAAQPSRKRPLPQCTVTCTDNSAATKRKRKSTSNCDNRSPKTGLAKKRGHVCLTLALTQKRKRPEPDQCMTSDGSSPSKKSRTVKFNEEPTDADNKILGKTKSCTSSKQANTPKKRTRAGEENSENSDAKKQRTEPDESCSSSKQANNPKKRMRADEETSRNSGAKKRRTESEESCTSSKQANHPKKRMRADEETSRNSGAKKRRTESEESCTSSKQANTPKKRMRADEETSRNSGAKKRRTEPEESCTSSKQANTPKKRMRAGEENSENSDAKKQRTEPDESCSSSKQANNPKKRMRADEETSRNSGAKKRRTYPEESCTSSKQANAPKKRTRDDEEDSGPMKAETPAAELGFKCALA